MTENFSKKLQKCIKLFDDFRSEKLEKLLLFFEYSIDNILLNANENDYILLNKLITTSKIADAHSPKLYFYETIILFKLGLNGKIAESIEKIINLGGDFKSFLNDYQSISQFDKESLITNYENISNTIQTSSKKTNKPAYINKKTPKVELILYENEKTQSSNSSNENQPISEKYKGGWIVNNSPISTENKYCKPVLNYDTGEPLFWQTIDANLLEDNIVQEHLTYIEKAINKGRISNTKPGTSILNGVVGELRDNGIDLRLTFTAQNVYKNEEGKILVIFSNVCTHQDISMLIGDNADKPLFANPILCESIKQESKISR